MSFEPPHVQLRQRPDAVRRIGVASGSIYRRFVRGHERPRGVAWFGIRSFWGHLRHFVASAIATEDVDSRDWMAPDDPRALMERVARLLGGSAAGVTVTERVGRDVWIDYLSDTGDDVAVSRAVARLVFAAYELPDPMRTGHSLQAPRGDVLLFGGDTAYPVATADEIRDRVIAPFNQVLAEKDDGRRRVLLGIPGNHDWYDGLDGFGRMFRRHVDYGIDGKARPTLHGSTRTLLGHYAEWAREFVRGGQVEKPKTLDLIGYTAVQSASYFVLPVAPGLSILGVDRQLKHVDSRQQHFFGSWLDQQLAGAPWVVLPDPVYRFGVPSPTGIETIRALNLTLSARPHLVLSGDIHHYRRELDGATLHVTAGGGGAFLHPAPVARRSARPAIVEWPNAAQSRALLWQVPWKVMLGRSGFIPHVVLAALLGPFMLIFGDSAAVIFLAAAVTLVMAGMLALIGGARRGPRMTLLVALVTASTIASASALVRYGLQWVFSNFVDDRVPALASSALELVVAVLIGAYLFGAYLAALTLLGYENLQAFTALDHPGFKHFVRFRVHADGTRVDGWCIGLVDPVRDAEAPVLVDAFSWTCR